jgi:hypothetical protein
MFHILRRRDKEERRLVGSLWGRTLVSVHFPVTLSPGKWTRVLWTQAYELTNLWLQPNDYISHLYKSGNAVFAVFLEMSLWNVESPLHATVHKKCPPLLGFERRAGNVRSDTKQILSLHHLIRIRIEDDRDKIKSFWLCVRRKGEPS